jgi:hypothetical protein
MREMTQTCLIEESGTYEPDLQKAHPNQYPQVERQKADYIPIYPQ